MKQINIPAGMTYLEARSVRQPTIQDYTKRIQEFQAWMSAHGLGASTSFELDLNLIDFMEEMFEAGRGVNDGVRVVAAARFFWPRLTKEIPRTVRGLKGWQLAAPPQQRMPIPIEALGAIMGALIWSGELELALRLFVQFLTYMRPGECSQLTVKQLVAPQSSSNQSFNFWAILLHPIEDLIPGKAINFRWVSDHRFRHLDKSPSPSACGGKAEARSTVVGASRDAPGKIQQHGEAASTRAPRPDSLRPAPRRRVARCALQAQAKARSQAKRPLVFRQQPEALREGGQTAKRAGKDPQRHQGVRKPGDVKLAQPSAPTINSHSSADWNVTITKRMIDRQQFKARGPKSIDGATLSKRIFKRVMKQFKKQFHGVFLDLFSGDGEVGKHLNRLGYPVISIDVCDDPRFDLTNRRVLNVVKGWIKSGCVLAIWLGTPCTSWSRARHGPLESAWGPLRR